MAITAVDGSASPVTTYSDGPGNPNQGSMVWAANAQTWWYFQINSANDSTGTPGTHKVSAWYNPYSSCAGDPGAGTWTYYGDSPNLDAIPNSTSAGAGNVLFRNGRSLGALYWNNSSGSNKDICHLAAGLFMASGVANDANATVGNLRIVLGSTTLTWGSFGYYITNKFNYANSTTQAAFAMGRGTDGRVHLGCAILTDQLDAAAIASRDVDTSDSWTTGGGQTTGTWSNGSAHVTSLGTETGMAVGYSMTGAKYGGTTFGTQQISTIDSGTQITLSKTTDSAGTNSDNWGWSNFTPGTRTNIIADSGMVNECNAFGFAALASGAMLMVYDNGAVAAPNFQELGYIKDSGTIAAGFWRNGTQDGSVFGTNNTQANNDWCLCSVSTTAIYCARRTATTTCIVRSYTTGTNTWAALTNAPPTMTGKNIVAGGGVCLVSDGIDMWLLVIDSTDAQVKYVKYKHGASNTNGTWGSWTNLAAAAATAAFLTATLANGYICATWSEKNIDGTHYNTRVASLSVISRATDSPTTSESLTRLFVGARATTDAPATSETITRTINRFRTATDAPTTSESLSRLFVGARATTDAPTTSESLNRTLNRLGTTTDAPTTSESLGRVFVGARAITGAPTTSESLNRIIVEARATTDAPTTSESLGRLFVGARTTTDAPTTSESASKTIVGARTTTDAPTTSESLGRLFVGARAATDAPTTSESSGRLFVGARVTTDTPTISESLNRIIVEARATTDAPTTSESLSRLFVGARTATGAPTTSESATTGSHAITRTITDAPTTSESLSRLFVGARTTTDAPTTSENASKTIVGARTTTDAPTTSESLSRLFVGARATTDVPVIPESLNRIIIEARATTDAPTTSESLGRLFVGARAITGAPTTSESLGRLLVGARAITDTPTTSESLGRLFVGARVTTDAPQISESAIALGGKLRATTDAPHTSEVMSRQFVGIRFTSDSTTISENLARLVLNNRSITETPQTAGVALGLRVRSASTTDTPTIAGAVTGLKVNVRTATESSQLSELPARIFTGLHVAVESVSSSELLLSGITKMRVTADRGSIFELLSAVIEFSSVAILITDGNRIITWSGETNLTVPGSEIIWQGSLDDGINGAIQW